MTAVFPKV